MVPRKHLTAVRLLMCWGQSLSCWLVPCHCFLVIPHLAVSIHCPTMKCWSTTKVPWGYSNINNLMIILSFPVHTKTFGTTSKWAILKSLILFFFIHNFQSPAKKEGKHIVTSVRWMGELRQNQSQMKWFAQYQTAEPEQEQKPRFLALRWRFYPLDNDAFSVSNGAILNFIKFSAA